MLVLLIEKIILGDVQVFVDVVDDYQNMQLCVSSFLILFFGFFVVYKVRSFYLFFFNKIIFNLIYCKCGVLL